jgi:hypothetical protein
VPGLPYGFMGEFIDGWRLAWLYKPFAGVQSAA